MGSRSRRICRLKFAGSTNMEKKVCLGLCLSALLLASGCADSESSGDCKEGAYSCVSNVLNKCDGDGVWQKQTECGALETCSETLGRCIPNADINKCEVNSFACVGQDLNKCDDKGNWIKQTTCSPDQMCNKDAGRCDPKSDNKCTENSYSCEGKVLKKCDAQGNWIAEDTCEANETCNKDAGACQCIENSYSCDGKVLKQCDNAGAWQTVHTCNDNETCDDQKGECKKNEISTPCTGDDYCADNAIVSCVDQIKQTTPCQEKICKVRSSVAVCEDVVCQENAVECKDSNTKKVCRDNQWVEESCGGGNICSDSRKDCVVKVCDENALRCNNNGVEKCVDNAWKSQEPCGSEKMCKDNACVTIQCTDGNKRCSDGALQRCEDNAYTTIDTCTGQRCQATSETEASCVKNVCNEGAFQCLSSGKLQECVDNAWVDRKDCGEGLCNATGKGCFECNSDLYKCEDKNLYSCTDHMWTPQATCQSAAACNATHKQCDECSGSEIACSGKELKECRDGKWKTKETCDSADLCDATNGVCKSAVVAECSGNGYQCTAGNVLQQCVDGSWATRESCATGTTCNATKKQCDECSGSASKCDGDQHKVCNDGKWQLDPCSSTQYCNIATGKCVTAECWDDGLVCDGAVLKNCSDHKLSTVANCGLSSLCGEKDGTHACLGPNWCNIQYVDDGFDQAFGRILIEEPLTKANIKARFACGSLDQAVASWHSVDAIWQNNCSTCGDNTEYHSYSFDGAVGNYQCSFIFDIGTNSYACLPQREVEGSFVDGGTPILLDNSTKLTADQTVALEVSAYDASHMPNWCHLHWIDKPEKKVYSRIFMGQKAENNQMSPIYANPVVYCTNQGAKNKLVNPAEPDTWKKFIGYQNLLFDPFDPNNHWEDVYKPLKERDHIAHEADIQFMADVSELSGWYECVFTYTFNGTTYVCPTDPAKSPSQISNYLADGYFWGEDFPE